MGKLYIVPTPVGNLEDMTFRAVKVLKEADLVRDTREGQFIFYELNASVLEEMLLWIQNLKGDTEND